MHFVPNPEQAKVIAAPAGARLVVDGGPGTGKTATAAARAIALIEAGIPPRNLCLISFTRAAVGEMRRRLSFLAGPEPVLPLVTTLDSFAWALRDGELDGDRPVVENYDAAIAETLSRLTEGDAHIAGRLTGLDHLIIDETQDLVGARAQLVIAIAGALRRQAGLTILTDEAQAIYGFAGKGLTANFAAETVAQHFVEQSHPFTLYELTALHRTDVKKLTRLFRGARRQALAMPGDPRRKLARMQRRIARHGLGFAKKAEPELILYRSRAEVLHASRAWMRAGKPHRLRLSGLPILSASWLALVLHDFAYDGLRQETFYALWRERIGTDGADKAWAALAGDRSIVSLSKLKKALGETEPPLALCTFDPGAEGAPILGTIHASKGREADTVRLMLPRDPARRTGRDDPDSEARVLFVGATRAKRHLSTGKGMALGARRLKSGRAFIPGKNTAEIEIGRPGDFIWSSEPGAALATARHGAPIELRYDGTTLTALLDGQPLGSASPSFLKDLREVRGAVSPGFGAFAATFEDIFLLDLGTLVVDGHFGLIPIFLSLTKISFKY
jgi:hypothetical protein